MTYVEFDQDWDTSVNPEKLKKSQIFQNIYRLPDFEIDFSV